MTLETPGRGCYINKLTKYVAVHPTNISEKTPLIRDANEFDKSRNSIYFSNTFSENFTHTILKRIKYHIFKIDYISIQSSPVTNQG